jgi:2-polyprenyl-3-methyl-5-hydroxy-6-metoxy-1,4-benzoquinol methylase
MTKYNTTDLDPKTAFEKHVFHRDQFAHYLRWTHVLNRIRTGAKVLDFGCGKGNLYEVLYRNRHKPGRYLGLDIRGQTIKANQARFPLAEFEATDLVEMSKDYGTDWDYITSFEVAEHVGRANVGKFLRNIVKHCSPTTTVLISTPVYDPEVGAADNHVVDGVVGELTVAELAAEITAAGFEVDRRFGTFASQKDIRPVLTNDEHLVYDRLKHYYDTELLSVLFAPLHPDQSRNNVWRLNLKQV